MSGSVLIVEDDDVLARLMRVYLESGGWKVWVSGSAEEALAALEREQPDVIVADYMLPGKNGLELLDAVRRIDPAIRVIMVTGKGNVQVAVDAMKAGAYDYLTKPVPLTDLKLLLDKAAGIGGTGGAHTRRAKSETPERGLGALLGESAPIRALRETIRSIIEAERNTAPGDLPAVLITGETGTGKEVVAQALHYEGVCSTGPFVEVNCASIPSTLLESELFGHERGAFTDAKESKAGLVEAAEGGTLFLDEIGEVSPGIQAKLLKLLEEKMVRRLGSVRERHADIRIVAATNQDLEQMARTGRFRTDLYFRLRIIALALPPLRERGDDVLLLARHFLDFHGRRYGKRDLALSPAAERALLRYRWPGNVRELRNALEHAVLLARGPALGAEELGVCLGLNREPEPASAPSPAAAYGPVPAVPLPRHGVKFREVERDLVVNALEKTDWNISKAARLLGITRDMMRTRIEHYALRRPAANQRATNHVDCDE